MEVEMATQRRSYKQPLRWLALLLIAAVALAGCRPLPTGEAPPATEELEEVVLSLDWVPNTNHTGFYVALDKGWYEEEGIDLEIQIPSDPAAALKQVAAGNTEFGVSFQEEVTIARSNDIDVVSIAAIIQHNTSAFAALEESGIETVAGFENQTYGSYGLPIERPILEGLMECADADADTVEFVDVGFDAFPALLGGRVDLAWIFMAWDGVQADLRGIELNTIPLYGSCIPDYYTPVIISGASTLAERPDLADRFMAATTRGYEYTIEYPQESAEILLEHSPESDAELVRDSQAWLTEWYQAEAPQWGLQDPDVWHTFAQWLYENELLEAEIDVEQAFTNEFLPEE
jgi:ABC-type nitrate/sulfonate/bicarbonate transport system substrate-binding protein